MSTPITPLPASIEQLEPNSELSVEEVSRTCAVHSSFILELVQEGVIEPVAGDASTTWRFHGHQLRRVTVAARLQRDLGVNLAGAALVLQLLDEVQTLRAQIGKGTSPSSHQP